MNVIRLFCAAIFCVLSAQGVFAVVTWGGANEAGSSSVAGWDYVGSCHGTYGSASGVFLGEYNGSYWVASCNHVEAYDFTINGQTYSYVEGSKVSMVGGADLDIFQISVSDGDYVASLPQLKLSSSSSSIFQDVNPLVTLVGYGAASQDANSSLWKVQVVNETTYIWSTNPDDPGVEMEGYYYRAGRNKSWGSNEISSFLNDYKGNNYYEMIFDPITGEAQAVAGDSGGGVFYVDPETGEVELVGLIALMGSYPQQGTQYVVEGNATYLVPIADYYDEMYTILNAGSVPEPTFGGLMLVGAGMMLLRRRF